MCEDVLSYFIISACYSRLFDMHYAKSHLLHPSAIGTNFPPKSSIPKLCSSISSDDTACSRAILAWCPDLPAHFDFYVKKEFWAVFVNTEATKLSIS